MSNSGPQTRWTTTGVQSVSVYPYGGLYDATTIEVLEGLQMVDFGMTVTLAEGFGGESPLLLFSAETKRTMELKASAFKVSLRLANLLLGGSAAYDGIGEPNEKQYWAASYTGRAKYFRMACMSNNGDGTAQLVFPKVKCSGSFSWNMKAEAINVTEFSGLPHYDSTYLCQDGQQGAIFDWFFGAGDNNTSPVS